MSGTLIHSGSQTTAPGMANSRTVTLDIWGDGSLLYSESINAVTEPIPFEIDLTGILEMEVTRAKCPVDSQ